MEKRIAELKYDLAADDFCLKEFSAPKLLFKPSCFYSICSVSFGGQVECRDTGSPQHCELRFSSAVPFSDEQHENRFSICLLPGVDWTFRPNGVPLYLFGIKDSAKARLTTISCLEFQRAKLNYKGIAVHEDFGKLGRKDVTRLTSACDKQFTNFDDFKQNAIQYLDREIHA